MAYPVVWLNQSSKFSLYTWVNLNFKLAVSQSRTEVRSLTDRHCLSFSPC